MLSEDLAHNQPASRCCLWVSLREVLPHPQLLGALKNKEGILDNQTFERQPGSWVGLIGEVHLQETTLPRLGEAILSNLQKQHRE